VERHEDQKRHEDQDEGIDGGFAARTLPEKGDGAQLVNQRRLAGRRRNAPTLSRTPALARALVTPSSASRRVGAKANHPGRLRELSQEIPFQHRYSSRASPRTPTRQDELGRFVLDFIVEDKVVLELKVVERGHAVHKAQVLSYLHATTLRLGLLINFNVPVPWRGVQRVVL
jgi:GxxExxY protein